VSGTTFDEPACLRLDPDPGDMGDDPRRLLRDVIATARHKRVCSHCEGWINPGERYRWQRFVCEGAFSTHRYCAACCAALVASDRDCGDELARRWGLFAEPAA
jgi:hypothetical protein